MNITEKKEEFLLKLMARIILKKLTIGLETHFAR